MTKNGAFTRCGTCRDLIFFDHEHTCPPLWRVWLEQDGESEYYDQRAPDPEEAARLYVESGGDLHDLIGETQVVCVRVHPEGVARYEIRVEASIDVYARELCDEVSP